MLFRSRIGVFMPRPATDPRRLVIAAVVSIGIVVVMAGAAGIYSAIAANPRIEPAADQGMVFALFGWLALFLLAATIVGLVLLIGIRRDVTAAYVVAAGVATGIVAAIISAPIAANVFGGVTGGGTDLLVGILRQGGADLAAATLGQALLSDPIDKVITFFVVYVIVGAMARRTRARFPQGERLLEADGPDDAERPA